MKIDNPKDLWNLFTSKHEYNYTYIDAFNRVPSWSKKENPMFDLRLSDYLNQNSFKPTYPDGKKFALCISHDVDLLFLKDKKRILREVISDVSDKKIGKIVASVQRGISKKIHPYYDLSKIIDIEQKFNANSSFFFLSLLKEDKDYNYELNQIGDVFDKLIKSKKEIGLHGGHDAFDNIHQLKKEKDNLESFLGAKIKGYRGHYLKFKTPDTWLNLNELGFEYDTTFGFAESIGFRNGTCYPFQPYDLSNDRFLDLIEIPLMIMDTSIYNYMKINPVHIYNLLTEFIDRVAAYNGVVTLLWHNTDAYDPSYEMFQKILAYAYSKNAWMPSGEELTEYWKKEKLHEKQNEILLHLKEKSC
jgi:hypothetical protein